MWIGEQRQALRKLVAMATLAALALSGCATRTTAVDPHGSTPPSIQASPGATSRSVLAVFGTSAAGAYTISVTARYDLTLHRVAAAAHGELETDDEDIYFVANTFDDAKAALTVDDSLAAASLRATMQIDGCTDEEGQKVDDGRCPIGQIVDVDVKWSSSLPIEEFGPVDSSDVRAGKGRKATANGTIGAGTFATSNYAVIMEHLTYQ
jgi:hypothetical protein